MKRILIASIFNVFCLSAVSIAQEPVAQEPVASEPVATESVDEQDQGADYYLELLSLEEDVNSLKERVFRSKATLQLLKEIVIEGSTTGSRATIWHVNELSGAYKMMSITYLLDGQSIYSRTDDDGALSASKEVKIWEGALPPGDHNITVSAVLQGNGFGVFSYVENYNFSMRSSYAFEAEDEHHASVRVVMDERKGIGRSFIERPQVVYEVQSTRLSEGE
jgi:hypothetical protein